MQEMDLRDILKKAEIKRVAENLTKKELCSVFGINYNFYMNCVSKRNYPSQIMIDALREYLEMPTAKVYEKVFAHRGTDEFIRNKNKDKFVKRNGSWKEEFHQALEIDDAEYDAFVHKLENRNILKEPTL
jgi:hypothetical protein